jgi:hypothetical protein
MTAKKTKAYCCVKCTSTIDLSFACGHEAQIYPKCWYLQTRKQHLENGFHKQDF